MGCIFTKKKIIPRYNNTLETMDFKDKNEINSIDELKITPSDLVKITFGDINQDYILPKYSNFKNESITTKQILHKKTNILRTAKIIKKSSLNNLDRERFYNEICILKNLDHPNIIKLIECYEDEQNFYLVAELCTGGTLLDRMNNTTLGVGNAGSTSGAGGSTSSINNITSQLSCISELESAKIMIQILSAINYCHQYHLAHRDLKPENIMYDSMRPGSILKIINFGIAQILSSDEKIKEQPGIINPYIAPEVLKGNYNVKCDIWSCGVILYRLFYGKLPFNGTNKHEIEENILKGNVNFKENEYSKISQLGIKFLKRLLDVNVKTRYTAKDALKDVWLQKIIQNRVMSSEKKITVCNTINNLQTIRFEKKLQEVIWLFLVTYMTTKEQKTELLKTFQEFDIDNDGILSREELIRGYTLIKKSQNPEAEVDELINSVDFNNNGYLEYTEFITAALNREKILCKERLEATFKMLDKDSSGYIDLEEIKVLFEGLDNQVITDDVWKDLIAEVDQNSDGKISLGEFKHMMMLMLN